MTTEPAPRIRPNAIPEDPDWCGHPMVSMRAWTCADCDRPLPEAARQRILAAPTKAQPGYVWVLTEGNQEDSPHDHDDPGGYVLGVYSDRARIPQIMVRGLAASAAYIRDRLRRIHWYTSVYNPNVLEGWDEEPDERGCSRSYYLRDYKIDSE